jgi:adenylate kinase
MLNIVLFGPPGAGKGTQTKKIINKYNLVSLATGDLLRTQIAKQTPLGIEAKILMDKGELVPDEMVIGMIKHQIEEHKNEASGFVFDGFPRTTKQAESLDAFLAACGYSINKMVALEVGKELLVSRLIGRGLDSGRPDDQDMKIIEHRIEVYNTSTAPVKEFYLKQNKFYSVHGVGEVEEVFNRICEAIEK